MKWLKIKKYLKIFSVIICSIFIFSNKINALEERNLNIDFNLYIDYFKNIEEIDYLKEIENMSIFLEENIKDFNYIFKIVCQANNEICGFDIQFYSKDIDNFYINDNYSENTFTIEAINNNDSKYLNWKRYQFNIEDMEEIKNQISEFIKNPKWQNVNIPKIPQIYQFQVENIENNYQNKIINDGSSFILMINTNFELRFNNVSNTDNIYNLYINDKTININDNIPKFDDYLVIENPLKYRMQFNNDVSPDLKQITFDFSSWEYTEGSNPVKSKIEIGNWNNTSNLANYLTQNIMGHGIDGIEHDVNEYFDIQIETVDYLTTKELTFTYNLKKELPENILRIKVYYDFETFDNNYFFNVFDNTSWGSPDWRYIENFLVGYKKYTFPDGYDLAIIRSKNFQDLKSFYISDKLYFTSPEYGYELKSYDFINKVVTYNFNSLTQYLFNPVYLKIPIKIDETNNIFPVLTKPLNTEKGVFYLKDDLFIQFVNSDTLESIVENIPEDEFNQNNDLIFGGDISDLKPIEINKKESLYQFFNGFWEKFNYFSDIFSYITACFTEFFLSLPSTIQFFLSASFAFIIFKLITYLIL